MWNGRKFRILNIINDFKREALAVEADTSMPTLRVISILDQLKLTRGLQLMIRVDNGPEFISFKLDYCCRQNHITLAFIQPGKPTQNALIERCNSSIRKELLSAYVFKSLSEVSEKDPGLDYRL